LKTWSPGLFLDFKKIPVRAQDLDSRNSPGPEIPRFKKNLVDRIPKPKTLNKCMDFIANLFCPNPLCSTRKNSDGHFQIKMNFIQSIPFEKNVELVLLVLNNFLEF
jgi:hypothetical protein